jgi:putative membrane protein
MAVISKYFRPESKAQADEKAHHTNRVYVSILKKPATQLSALGLGFETASMRRQSVTNILFKWLVLTASIMITSYIIDGIHVDNVSSAFLAAAVLGILNVFLRPIAIILTLPVNILSLGLFTFAINALMLIITSATISGFEVKGFWAAVIGSFIISIISWVMNSLVKKKVTIKVENDPGFIDLKDKGNNKWE